MLAAGPAQTNLVVVEMADLAVVQDPQAELVTYSLGSCIGVAIHDPVANVGGLLHFMLPNSKISATKARQSPGMFADTGVPLLFRRAYRLGASKQRLIVKIAGGAKLFDASENLDVGQHNRAAIRDILARNHIQVRAEHVGGTISRTMRLFVSSGMITVENRAMGRVEL
jgi:chemotaxis protein CheD